MRQDCALYVRGCHVCQQVNRKNTPAYGTLGERPIPESPFEVISADHLSLPTIKADYGCYILVHIPLLYTSTHLSCNQIFFSQTYMYHGHR